MTMDTVYGAAQAAPTDYNWLRLLRRSDRRRLRIRPAIAYILRALGLLAAAGSSAQAAAPAAIDDQAVIELRQYTLHPGQRDTLIEIFEQNFIEGQEQAGMRVLGQFRDLDKPDRFVWLRSFPSMPARKASLEAFYSGPVWQAHREAANATMIDSDNVLLLRPAHEQAGFRLDGLGRPATDAATGKAGLIVATLWYLQEPATPALLKLLRTRLEPQLRADGATVLASLTSESSPNTFPKLPVRLGENVLIVFTAFDDAKAHADFAARQAASADWQELDKRLQAYLKGEPEIVRLAPTRRSLLR
jgi:quinol monooxygenase YgiN